MEMLLDEDYVEILSEDEMPIFQRKKAIVAVGRFNPPTRGHYKVLETAYRYQQKRKLDGIVVVVIDSKKSSEDKKKNPLTADERIRYMQHSGRANWVSTYLTAGNAFEAFVKVREAGFEPTVIAAGSDRADSYLKMLDKYFTDVDGNPVKHETLEGLDRDEDAAAGKNKDAVLDSMKDGHPLDLEDASASLARRAAELGYYKEFVDIVGQEKNKAAAKQMYEKIRKAMGVSSNDDDKEGAK